MATRSIIPAPLGFLLGHLCLGGTRRAATSPLPMGTPHPMGRLDRTRSSWIWDKAFFFFFFQGTRRRLRLLPTPQECARAPGGRAPVCCFNK